MRVFTMPAPEWDENNIDKQAVRHLILKHRACVKDLAQLKAYYKGKHKILSDEGRENKLV